MQDDLGDVHGAVDVIVEVPGNVDPVRHGGIGDGFTLGSEHDQVFVVAVGTDEVLRDPVPGGRIVAVDLAELRSTLWHQRIDVISGLQRLTPQIVDALIDPPPSRLTYRESTKVRGRRHRSCTV